MSPLVLVPPASGRHLLLYLLVSDIALGCMLAQLDDSNKERVIYYLSKRMLDYEIKYDMIEHYCLAFLGYSTIETLHDRVLSASDIPSRSPEIFV